MREMKDSGIEWIGQIPEGWELRRAKTLFTQRNSKGNGIEVLLSPTQKYGVVPQSQLEGVVQVKEDTDLQMFKTVHKGDFVISLRSFQGGFEYSLYEGVCSPAYQVFYPTSPICDTYYRYLFKSQSFISKMNNLTVGIREGKNIQYVDFANSQIPVPPLAEQERIAAFLDAECAEIDAVLEKTRASIEEYKKLKQAVITQAVTKGVRGNRPMKDSGIEWIGEIANEFAVYKFKYLLKTPMQYGANEAGITFDKTLPRYIRITDITSDGRLKQDNRLCIEDTVAKPYILQDGDLLFARSGGTVGKSFLYKQSYGNAAFAGYLIRAVVNRTIAVPEYVYYYTNSSIYDTWKNSIFIQSTIQNIGADRYSNMPIIVPNNIEEQRSIVEYLNERCVGIDALIRKKQQYLTEIENYKKSLIYEYVTGKKEVLPL